MKKRAGFLKNLHLLKSHSRRLKICSFVSVFFFRNTLLRIQVHLKSNFCLFYFSAKPNHRRYRTYGRLRVGCLLLYFHRARFLLPSCIIVFMSLLCPFKFLTFIRFLTTEL